MGRHSVPLDDLYKGHTSILKVIIQTNERKREKKAGFLTLKHFHTSQWDLMFYRILRSNILYNIGANYLTVVWGEKVLGLINMQWQAEKEFKSD